jgi:hypothetical protein
MFKRLFVRRSNSKISKQTSVRTARVTKSDEAFERILNEVGSALDPEGLKQIKSYWCHGEPELAFEGLVNVLRKINFPITTAVSRDLSYLANNLGMEDYLDRT